MVFHAALAELASAVRIEAVEHPRREQGVVLRPVLLVHVPIAERDGSTADCVRFPQEYVRRPVVRLHEQTAAGSLHAVSQRGYRLSHVRYSGGIADEPPERLLHSGEYAGVHLLAPLEATGGDVRYPRMHAVFRQTAPETGGRRSFDVRHKRR